MEPRTNRSASMPITSLGSTRPAKARRRSPAGTAGASAGPGGDAHDLRAHGSRARIEPDGVLRHAQREEERQRLGARTDCPRHQETGAGRETQPEEQDDDSHARREQGPTPASRIVRPDDRGLDHGQSTKQPREPERPRALVRLASSADEHTAHIRNSHESSRPARARAEGDRHRQGEHAPESATSRRSTQPRPVLTGWERAPG